jgi:polysaccharide biosynthesis protein PslH
MRILFISTNVPVPPNNGQAIRNLSILRGLASSGHSITFISFSNKESNERFPLLYDYCSDVITVRKDVANASSKSAYFARVQCMLKLKPYSVERFRSKEMTNAILKALEQQVDLILCDGMYALVNLPPTDLPIVLNCHNVEHVIYRRYVEVERNPVRKAYGIFESTLMYKAEFDSLKRATSAMACSEIDRRILREMSPDLRVCVVPNTVDTNALDATETAIREEPEKPVILFQGGMDWYPNRDAVEFFVRQILPRIRDHFPNVRFIIAGRNPPRNFVDKWSKAKNVEFTGTVPDMSPYLAKATIVVVPLRIGGGTRLKILEACAKEKPIVSTTVGAEGLDLIPGVQILLADEPNAFAQTVLDLLKDRTRCVELGRSARRLVVEKYSQSSLHKILENALAGIGQSKKS